MTTNPTKLDIKFERAWIISDLHFGIRSASTDWLNIAESYFYDFFIPHLLKNKKDTDVLFVLGDIYDNRSSLNLRVLNLCIRIFEDLAKIMPIIIFPGNHDLYRMDSIDINSLKTLKWIPNVNLIEKPCIINCAHQKSLIVPWVGDFAVESKILSSNPADYAFMHTDFAGMKYDRFNKVDVGIDGNLSRNFKKIFSGHIHTRQEYENTIMVGSPYPMTRNDIGNSKGIYLLDFTNDDIQFFENTHSPKFVQYKFDYIIELTLEEIERLFNDNFVDVIINTDFYNNFSSLYELFPNVRRFKFLNEKFVNTIESMKETGDYSHSIESMENFNILNACKEYSKTLPEFNGMSQEIQTDILLMLQKFYDDASENVKYVNVQ